MPPLPNDDQDAGAVFPISPWRLIACGPLIGILSGTFSYALQRWINPDITLQPIGQYLPVVTYNVFAWTTWLAFWPLAWWLGSHVRISGPRRLAAAAVHIASGLAAAAAHCVMAGSLQYAVLTASGQPTLAPGRPVTWAESVKRVTLFSFEWEVLVYWGIVGLAHALHFYRELGIRDIRESQLQARLVEARLEALQRQLHPHFIFNTLNAVAQLIHRDPAAAEGMIIRLSDLLRAVFRSAVQQEVPLARELELTHQYLEIQRVKFGTELLTAFTVPQDLKPALVPVLILQPLVENSFKHGLQHRSGGIIRVTARALNDRLELIVSDNGLGVSSGAMQQMNEGVGLTNTRSRLEHLYAGDYSVSFHVPQDGGFAVTLSFPLQIAQEEPITLRRPA